MQNHELNPEKKIKKWAPEEASMEVSRLIGDVKGIPNATPKDYAYAAGIIRDKSNMSEDDIIMKIKLAMDAMTGLEHADVTDKKIRQTTITEVFNNTKELLGEELVKQGFDENGEEFKKTFGVPSVSSRKQ